LWTGESAHETGSRDFFEEHAKVYIDDCFAGRFDEKTIPKVPPKAKVLDLGCGYSQKEFKAMLEPYFIIEQTFLHFFPARSLPIPVPKVLHRALDGTFGFMIYAFLTKN